MSSKINLYTQIISLSTKYFKRNNSSLKKVDFQFQYAPYIFRRSLLLLQRREKKFPEQHVLIELNSTFWRFFDDFSSELKKKEWISEVIQWIESSWRWKSIKSIEPVTKTKLSNRIRLTASKFYRIESNYSSKWCSFSANCREKGKMWKIYVQIRFEGQKSIALVCICYKTSVNCSENRG